MIVERPVTPHGADADTVLCPFILQDSPCDARAAPGAPLRKLPAAFGLQAYIATEPAHVRAVFTSASFGTDGKLATVDDPEAGVRLPPLGPAGSLFRREHHNHLLLRQRMSPALSRPRVEAWRSRIGQLVHARLDRLEPATGTPVDFKTRLAEPLTQALLPEVLGIRIDTGRMGALGNIVTNFKSPLEQVQPARDEIYERLGRAIDNRATGAGIPLIDELIGAHRQGHIGREDVVGLTAFTYFVGVHGLASYLTSVMFALLRYADQWELLCRRPGMVPQAVEELTRFVPFLPSGGLPRVATEDTRLGCTDIRKGDIVVPALAFANRDPELCHEGDRLDITRSPRRHLGFGVGAHYCLGSALVRVVLEVLLSTLICRLPHLRLATPPEALAYRKDSLIRSLQALPITW